MHLSGLDDQHRAYVFSALEEMPPIGRFRTDESREVKSVVGIRKNQEVLFRTTHSVSVARASIHHLWSWCLLACSNENGSGARRMPHRQTFRSSRSLLRSTRKSALEVFLIGNRILPASFGRHSL